ncbi:nucleotidyltransferase family protein [Winogradskyella vincentii]|uniref:Nucleotidyltransferase family protein n=1 Tax=Winogradskyella vincentii TaxID=2877122 RepID=A0ABS7XW59_9FLAO|nr:nucleotidyltransferase family protein [Winogradskyella vincentii]MCA0151883.1 nucleotidyltransferase family protein [Winogradskyella vincentii]
MGSLLNTYRLIADILSFESEDGSLKSQLKSNTLDWDSLVKVGSSHLVLPTIYCRLKSKKLLDVIPEELEAYLKEITELNRERNLAIIVQVKNLAQLLDEHHIEYVFLKGAALLVGDYYDDISERMIGDIDILIAESDLEKAFELLKNESYTPLKQTLGNHFFEHKHLPRLTTKKHICAVELHRKLFISYQHKYLTNSNIIDNKVIYKSLYIPSLQHLSLHNILNYQINDKGHLYKGLNFRASFDTLVLNKKYEIDLTKNYFNTKLVKQYVYRSNGFFKDFNNITTIKSTRFLNFKLNNKWFHKVWYKTLSVYSYLGELIPRFVFFVINSDYRGATWKDRKRIINHLRLKLLSKT